MSGKHIWKLATTFILVAFCLSYLIPLEDHDFAEFVAEQSTDEEFQSLLSRAVDQAAASETDDSIPVVSAYVALKTIANDERIDVSKFFPKLLIEASITSVEKRNNILLPELLKLSQSNLKKGLDIEGGISVTFQVDPEELAALSEDERTTQLTDAIGIIERRVNGLGVSEPIVRPVGEDRIEVQLAGISIKTHPNIVEAVGKPARLDFREVHKTARPGRDLQPVGYRAMTLVSESNGIEIEEELYVKRIPALTGRYVETAFPRSDAIGGIEVILNFDSDGATLFADVTRRLAGNPNSDADNGRLAIILDDVLQSAPNVRQAITGGNASITGRYSQREALELSNTLNNPLEIKLTVAEMYEVGPTMADDAIASGIKASQIGVGAVSIFMIVYFMFGGLVALVSVVLNVLIVLGVLASFQATITLPGIAGIILTVGMAVDANILIFERIREELRSGKGIKNALTGGFDKVFSTIFDANVTTLIVSLVMVYFGTGPVKGFGVTLAIGIMSTMFCALIVTRVLLELLFETDALKKFAMLSLVGVPKIDFLKFRKPAFIASWSLVAIGIFALYSKGDSIYGVDFTGGDEVILSFEEHIDEGEIRSALEPVLGEVTPSYRSELGNADEELRVQTAFEEGKNVLVALNEAFPVAKYEVLGSNTIGPSVGKEIQTNAFKAIGISLGLILLYIAFRFEIGYGVGAIVATIHDVLLTVGVFVLVPGHQFTAPMVAAILLIVGYSLNDTIVLFDRIREELALRPTTKLRSVINIAINAVLSRTMLTSVTTLLASVSLMVFGTGVINDIAFTFTIGIITGTFSSIFIAAPVFFFWHKGDRRSVESSHDIAPEYDWQASSKISSSGSSKEQG